MSNPKARTPELIDSEIAAAEQSRDDAYELAKRYGVRMPVDFASPLGANGDPALAARGDRAWQAAWQAERDVLLLQRERATVNVTAHEATLPPSDAEISQLSAQLDEAKRTMVAFRRDLFQARGAVEDYERRSVDLRRKVVELGHALHGAEREIARFTERAEDAERVAATREARALHAAAS